MTDILPQPRVLEILLELDGLLQKLPSSLPLPEKGQSRYLKLLSFHPLPLDWLADIGVVGTVNRQLEVIFGTRTFGFKLQERGATLESVIPILQHYLEQFPGDIILQKWLLDLHQAASEVHAYPENNPSKSDTVMDLTGERSDTESLPEPSRIVSRKSDQKRHRSNGTASTDESPSHVEDGNPIPKHKTSRKAKARKPHKKRKGSLAPRDNIDTLPEAIDPNWRDVPEHTANPSKGGAPPDQLARELTRPCYPTVETSIRSGLHYRCIASSVCRWAAKGGHRNRQRVYTHSVRCDALKRWKPELHLRVETALAGLGSSSSKDPATQVASSAVGGAAPPLPDAQIENRDPFAPFRAQGELDFKTRANLSIVRLLCASGTPPRIADSLEWRNMCQIFISTRPGNRYTPPSTSTLRDKLIPAEAAQVTLNCRRILRDERNITLSFDGLTKGKQSLYTVHAITGDRLVFLYKGDVFRGSHNSNYIYKLLNEVINEIGVSRIAAVVSDDTNTTKKARRDITATYPSIINLADPIHKMNLLVKDISEDVEWNPMLVPMRETLNFFSHSSHANVQLQDSREDLSITLALISMGTTRFGSMYISAKSVLTNLPAIHHAHRKEMFKSIPESLEAIFDETTMAAMQFKLALMRFTRVLEPIYRALTCLESSNSTLGDVFAYWLAAIASLEQHFSSSDCDIPQGALQRFKLRVQSRFAEAINDAPCDAFIAGHFLHPGFRDADIYHRMNAMSSKLFIRIPAPNPLSPAKHIPEGVFKRIRKFVLQVLYQLLKVSESIEGHDLHMYDASEAKAQCEAQLGEYARGNHPFHRPLGKNETTLDYWRSLKRNPEAFVLAVVGEKVNAVLPNSMSDERTGSRITFLDSSLRSCTDVKTMVEQIQVMKYYAMYDGNIHKKRRAPPKFRDFIQPAAQEGASLASSSSAGLGGLGDDGSEWLDEVAVNPPQAPLPEAEVDALVGQFSALRIFNLRSPALLSMLSDAPAMPPAVDPQPDAKGKGKQVARVTAADDIDWD